MKNFAQVINSIVHNIIIADSIDEAKIALTEGDVIESTSINPAFIGGQYKADLGIFCYPDSDVPTVTQELMQAHFQEGHELSPIINQYIDVYTQVYSES